MNGLTLIAFAIAAGFTASGIVANAYRLCGFANESAKERALLAAVMVVAGPCMIFDTAIKGRISKAWTPVAFWVTAALAGYWSLGLGLLVIDIARCL
jgi:roadblock/LC7 domain-containing protein